uniref:Nucleosome assembly protein 1-like 5 n=1 Tax=Sus scrofa TaxID=9823 RepID=A0A8D1TQX6_PIG
MADPENQGPAEPGQAAAAAAAAEAAAAVEEVMAEGGAQGGDSDSASGDSDGAVGQTAEEPQAPAENAPKPRNDFIESLPNSVKCRVLALKKLQKRCDKIEAKFDKEFQALEKKYNDIYKPLLAKIQELTDLSFTLFEKRDGMQEAGARDHDSTVNEAKKTATSNSKDCAEYVNVVKQRGSEEGVEPVQYCQHTCALFRVSCLCVFS